MNPRQARCAGIITVIGMALVIATHLVRPWLASFPSWLILVVGVLPNFGAALSLPFLMLVFAARFLRLGGGRLLPRFVLALGATFLGLTAWELAQHVLWAYPIDPNDIWATGLGAACAAAAYALFFQVARPTDEP